MTLFIEPISLILNDLFLSLVSISLKPQQSTPGNNESSQVESTKEGNPSTTVCDSQDVRLT